MSAPAVALARLRLPRESANQASSTFNFDRLLEEKIMAQALAAVTELPATAGQRRGQVVVLRARSFEDTARHFLKVATPVNWPTDEPDID